MRILGYLILILLLLSPGIIFCILGEWKVVVLSYVAAAVVIGLTALAFYLIN
jgi:hypothetical protein